MSRSIVRLVLGVGVAMCALVGSATAENLGVSFADPPAMGLGLADDWPWAYDRPVKWDDVFSAPDPLSEIAKFIAQPECCGVIEPGWQLTEATAGVKDLWPETRNPGIFFGFGIPVTQQQIYRNNVETVPAVGRFALLAVIPEPGTLALTGVGLAALLWMRRKRR